MPASPATGDGGVHLPDVLQGHFLRAAEQRDPCIVHPDIEAPEGLDGAASERVNRGRVGDVRRYWEAVTTVTTALVGDVLECRLAPGRQDHPGTPSGECVGGGASDAAGSTRDHDHLVAQLPRHDHLTVRRRRPARGSTSLTTIPPKPGLHALGPGIRASPAD